MKKQLKPNGNGWVLPITKQIQKLLGYSPNETLLLVTAKCSTLYFEPIKDDIEKYSKLMVRKFQKRGGSYAIYFPMDLIDVLELDPAYDYIDVQIDEDKMIVKKFKQ